MVFVTEIYCRIWNVGPPKWLEVMMMLEGIDTRTEMAMDVDQVTNIDDHVNVFINSKSINFLETGCIE